MNWIARIQQRPALLSILVIVAFALAMLSPDIFTPGRLIGAPGGDMDSQFAAWRAFAFANLSCGNIPEWNPHIFGGVPFLEGWQSSLFYPINWIGLILPLDVTLNLHLLIHSSVVGIGMWMWLRGRGCSNAASVVGAIIVIGAGSWFARIYSGMHANLASMAWTPLMLWTIDRIIENPFDRRAMTAGIISVSFTLLGGHPQYTYYLILVSILYFIYRWIRQSKRTWKPLASMSLVGLLALMLTAIQWMPSLDASDEFLRGRKLTPGFAAAYALPSENLITTVTPDAFGRPNGHRPEVPAYWGRGFYWEASAFLGVGVLVLAMVGATSVAGRPNWSAMVAVGLGTILAVGYDTPLWEVLYSYFPGWGQFRGMSKLLFYVSIVMALLSSRGVDQLMRGIGRKNAVIGLVILGSAFLLVCVVVYLGIDPTTNGLWQRVLHRIVRSRESEFESMLADPAVSSRLAQSMLRQLLWTLPWFILAFVALMLRGRWTAIALVGMALAGLIRFDRSQLESVAVDRPLAALSIEALKMAGKDSRVIFNQLADQNQGMRLGFENAWGVDPLVLKRWFEVLALACDQSPDAETPNLRFRKINPNLMRLLRVGAVVPDGSDTPVKIDDPLPLAFVPKKTITVNDRNATLLAMLDPNFNARETSFIEHPSEAGRTEDGLGEVQAKWIDSDSLRLRVDLQEPSVVVITNAFARGWTATLVGNRRGYRVMPANHALQAIRLPAGKYEIVMEYHARLLGLGILISAMGLIGIVSLMFIKNRRE